MFHWKDGWFFWRNDDGSVSFEHRVYTGEKSPTGEPMYTNDVNCTNVPAAEWASILAAVTPAGETAETYQQALAFHMAK